jgi:hypothetical protein
LLTKPHRQEALSRAYIQAVAARCGLSYQLRGTDYGIDLSLHEIVVQAGHYREAGHQLDIQLRSTATVSIGATDVRYDLEVRAAYNVLRDAQVRNPRVLVLYVFPEEEGEWLTCSEEQTVLRRSANWLSVVGKPSVQNRRTIRVAIPRTNLFSVEGLQGLLKRLREGEVL